MSRPIAAIDDDDDFFSTGFGFLARARESRPMIVFGVAHCGLDGMREAEPGRVGLPRLLVAPGAPAERSSIREEVLLLTRCILEPRLVVERTRLLPAAT